MWTAAGWADSRAVFRWAESGLKPGWLSGFVLVSLRRDFLFSLITDAGRAALADATSPASSFFRSSFVFELSSLGFIWASRSHCKTHFPRQWQIGRGRKNEESVAYMNERSSHAFSCACLRFSLCVIHSSAFGRFFRITTPTNVVSRGQSGHVFRELNARREGFPFHVVADVDGPTKIWFSCVCRGVSECSRGFEVSRRRDLSC